MISFRGAGTCLLAKCRECLVIVCAGIILTLLPACTYGPEQLQLNIYNVVTKPRSHMFAMAMGYSVIRPATGLSSFPDGGVPKILRREPRIYLGDLDSLTLRLVATVPNYADIPQPKSAWVMGWKGDELYFRVFGYGGSTGQGDDLKDKRELLYKVTASGDIEKISLLPDKLETETNSPANLSPPFVAFSTGYLTVDFALDKTLSSATEKFVLKIDPNSAEPSLTAK